MTRFERGFFVPPHERRLVERRMAPAWSLERLSVSLFVGILLWGGAGFLLGRAYPDAATQILALAALALLLQLVVTVLYLWRRIGTTEYVVTEEAVYARRGRLILAVSTCTLDRVTDIHVHTSLAGRVFGYSLLDVRTAGGSIGMPGLRDAYEVRSAISGARHAFIRRLLVEAGRTAAPADASAPNCQCPACGQAFRVGPARPLDVECPRCHEKGMLFEEAAA